GNYKLVSNAESLSTEVDQDTSGGGSIKERLAKLQLASGNQPAFTSSPPLKPPRQFGNASVASSESETGESGLGEVKKAWGPPQTIVKPVGLIAPPAPAKPASLRITK
ncbi:hypothetical protein HDV05_000631, partial [Chytridiales sp. JEL 0842]